MSREMNAVAGMTQRKTALFTLRMDPVLKGAAEKCAADERLSLSALIEKLLKGYCQQYGYLEPERELPKPGRKR